jgi:hypothetical protein
MDAKCHFGMLWQLDRLGTMKLTAMHTTLGCMQEAAMELLEKVAEKLHELRKIGNKDNTWIPSAMRALSTEGVGMQLAIMRAPTPQDAIDVIDGLIAPGKWPMCCQHGQLLACTLPGPAHSTRLERCADCAYMQRGRAAFFLRTASLADRVAQPCMRPTRPLSQPGSQSGGQQRGVPCGSPWVHTNYNCSLGCCSPCVRVHRRRGPGARQPGR